MKNNFRHIIITFLLYSFFSVCTSESIIAQEKPEFGGYLSDMTSFMVIKMYETDRQWENLLHNRLNFGWQFMKNIRFDAGLRTRFTLSETNRSDCFDILFDRFYFSFEKNRWKLQLGRQRVNWGQTLVWNPNDIFNTYSFFDFDYPERPGSDSFRATYYNSETASTEIAASYNSNKTVTAALMHHRNWENIDFQIMGGFFQNTDIVFGGAFTGDFVGLNFRGEFSFFQQAKNDSSECKLPPPIAITASLGLDYLFSNSLMIQVEALYNHSESTLNEVEGPMSLYSAPLSAKNLSVCKHNYFAQISYPLTERINGALSGMYFNELKAVYGGVSLDCSLLENLDLSLILQYFTNIDTAITGDMSAFLSFIRLKYSF